MHMPYKQAHNYMDALLAFWSELQVLKGDLKEAIKMHELLYQIVKKHKFDLRQNFGIFGMLEVSEPVEA